MLSLADLSTSNALPEIDGNLPFGPIVNYSVGDLIYIDLLAQFDDV